MAARRRLLVVLGLAALIGVAAWLFTRVGLLRLQSQLASQISNEDQRARAGDVAGVLALQAADEPAWREQVSARARLGLAAPLPAGDLLPAGTPPRLIKLDPLGGDLFSAVVSRDYVDSAGQTYTFDLNQRYTCSNCGAGAGSNLAPGQWARLPPDTSALNATTVFSGQRLSITVPTADLPWLRPALLQADDFLVQTCADWGNVCPGGERLSATFGLGLELNSPTLVVRPPAAQGSGYPRVFDLLNAASRFSDGHSGYDLTAPLLAGRPHDAAAQAALSRSISARLLSLFAGEVSGAARGADDYFLDALVARAEVRRLGASAQPQALTPQNFVPLKTLWGAAATFETPSGWRTDLAARREVFDFLNSALGFQPPSVDGQLLLSLRGHFGQGPDDWLASGLGPQGRLVTDAWTQQALAAFASHPAADWSQYEGLALACDDAFYQVRGGSPKVVWQNNPVPGVRTVLGPASADGRYMTLEYYGFEAIAVEGPSTINGVPSPLSTLIALDRQTGRDAIVFSAPVVEAVGWSSDDKLIYTVNNSRLSQDPPAATVPLWAYDPATSYSRPLIPERVVDDVLGANAWSADHSSLLLTVADQTSPGQFTESAALLTFGPSPMLRQLDVPGQLMALSPDGRRILFLPFDGSTESASNNAAPDTGVIHLKLFEVATGAITTLTTNDPRLPVSGTGFSTPRWSPDSTQLAWYDASSDQAGYLVSAPAAAGPLHIWTAAPALPGWQLDPVGFSPDGKQLAALVQGSLPSLGQYWLFARQSSGTQPPVVVWANSMVWSPTDGQLVIAGPAGVSAVNPGTGSYEWLGNWANCQLSW